MPCLIAALAMVFPRVAIIFLAVFSDYMKRGMALTTNPLLFEVLGFFFLPYTTLAYVYAINNNGSPITGHYQIILIIAVLVDLGVLGGGERARRGQSRRSRE